MAYPPPTVTALANFSGRASASYLPYATTALAQAALLFTLVTGVSETPDDADEAALINNAILEMADDLYLKQPFVAIKAKPFTSESIGSYSYSVGSSAFKALSGDKTGLLWWDLAVKRLGSVDSVYSNGAIAVFDRNGNIWQDADGHSVLVGPAEVSNHGLSYNDLGFGYTTFNGPD